MNHSGQQKKTSPLSKKHMIPWKTWFQKLSKGVRVNWQAKVLVVLVAMALWAGLISQDPSLTREKTFTDFSIRTSGADTMNRNGFIVVSDLEGALKGTYMRAAVPQMQYDDASVSSYDPRIDLSRINSVGTQTVKVQTTSTSTYGSVEAITPDTVEVEVEEYMTRYRIPLTISAVGTPPTGFYATAPNADPPNLTVSGPKSLVETISRAEAVVDVSTLPAKEGLARTAVPFTLLNSEGKEVESRLITVSSNGALLDSIIAEQEVYPTKQLFLSALGLTIGTPADGYEVKSVSADPQTVVAAGASGSLNQLDMIFLESPVDVQDAYTSFTQEISIRKRDELVYLSADKVMVSVEIGEIVASKTFDNLNVSLVGLGEGLAASITNTKISVTISGPKLWLDTVKATDISLQVNAVGLEDGRHELSVVGTVKGAESVSYTIACVPETVTVTIVPK